MIRFLREIIRNFSLPLKSYKYKAFIETMDNTLFIDTGYFAFYRYHAAKRWLSFKEECDQENPWQNEEIFRDCLMKQVLKHIKKYCKNRKRIFIALESLDGSKNWRKDICEHYKANRVKNSDIHGFMKYLYTYLREFASNSGNCEILHKTCHEADDLIALKCREVLNENPQEDITILTSDSDFLQLVETQNNVKLMNATEKIISDKPIVGQLYLKHKILEGDTADNITPVFSGRNRKKRINAIIDKIKHISLDEVNETYFESIEDYEKFKKNRALIDFSSIIT